MCPHEFCWGLSTTPPQTGQTNSSLSGDTNFSECWTEVSADSQELIADSAHLLATSPGGGPDSGRGVAMRAQARAEEITRVMLKTTF